MAGGVPVIDLAPLAAGGPDVRREVGRAVDRACREHGFFSVVGHGVDQDLVDGLVAEARSFFALDRVEKAEIVMARGGRAWRGWFAVGDELTSGVPDRKEGLYFGDDLPEDDPRVIARTPLHGANLYPRRPPGLATAVPRYMAELTGLGHRLMATIALGLGLDERWFHDHLTARPTTMLRVFRYPTDSAEDSAGDWGVAEHTDYGLLTLLHQDRTGGLEVHTAGRWVPVAPVPGALVCNIGDMLEAMTGGRYRSTAHRVRSPRAGDRISVPFFFDPDWDAVVGPLPEAGSTDVHAGTGRPRWDGRRIEGWQGRYGDYLTGKVGKVFPDLVDGAW